MAVRMRLMVATSAVVLAAACGSSADAGDGGMRLSIASPGSGDAVSMPFTVELDPSVELGPEESGRHHVHVFFDGNEEEYQVVESTTVEITDLSPGEHSIGASLRNADHSPTGAEAEEVTVTVTGSGEDGGGGTGGDGGGFGY